MTKTAKKRRGRPKESRNKTTKSTTFSYSNKSGWKPQQFTGMETITLEPTEPHTFLSRLEVATVKYEQAIKEAIQALKGN
jgi:hypothetical protein